MKEASGELSMTAVAVVAIGALVAIFTTLILPSIKTSLAHNTACSNAYACKASTTNSNEQTCTVAAPDGDSKNCGDIGAVAEGTVQCSIVCDKPDVD